MSHHRKLRLIIIPLDVIQTLKFKITSRPLLSNNACCFLPKQPNKGLGGSSVFGFILYQLKINLPSGFSFTGIDVLSCLGCILIVT